MKGLVAGIILFYSALLFGTDGDKNKLTLVDEKSNKPLIGANILLGENQGLSTDVNGDTWIDAGKDTTYDAVFSYVGYDKLRGSLQIQDGIVTPDTVRLRQSPITSDEVLVVGRKEESLETKTKGNEKISEVRARNTNVLSGRGLSDMVFAQTRGYVSSSGKTSLYSADKSDLLVTWNGIKRSIQGFFGFDATGNMSNTEFEMYTFGAPPTIPDKFIGILNTTTKKPTDYSTIVQVDHLRTSVNTHGPSSFLFGTWYDINFEYNIASVWNIKNFRPKKNELTLVLGKRFGNTEWRASGLYSDVSLEINRQEKAFQEVKQFAGETEVSALIGDVFLEGQYVYSNTSDNIFLKGKLDLLQGEENQMLKVQGTTEDFLGPVTVGLKTKYLRHSMVMKPAEGLNVLIKDNFAVTGEVNNLRFDAMPTYFFFKQDLMLDGDVYLSFGSIFLGDFEHRKKPFVFGPYFKIGKKDKNDVTVEFTVAERFDDLSFNPFETGVLSNDYSSSKFPKCLQMTFSIEKEKGLFDLTQGIRLSYYKFYDQYDKSVNVNPLDKYFIKYAGMIDQDSLRAAIINDNPESFETANDYKRLDSLLAIIPKTKEEARIYIQEYGEIYPNNNNRYGFAFDIGSWNDKYYVNLTLSKTMESGRDPVPYKNSVDLALKVYVNQPLFEINNSDISLVVFAEYSTGRPYTPRTQAPSIKDRYGFNKEIEKYGSDLPAEYINLLEANRSRPLKRNSSRYSPSLTSSISLSYPFNKIFGLISGDVSLYVINPHISLGIDKNVTQIYYTYKNDLLVQRKGKGPGTMAGFGISLRF